MGVKKLVSRKWTRRIHARTRMAVKGLWTRPRRTAGMVLMIVPKMGMMLRMPAMSPSRSEKSTPKIQSPMPVRVPLMQQMMS